MAMSQEEYHAIGQAIDAHYQQIRKSGQFTIRDGWEGFNCTIQPDPGDWPTLKEMRSMDDPKASWRARGGSVTQPGAGKPKPCSTCGKGQRVVNRTRCGACLYRQRANAEGRKARTQKRHAELGRPVRAYRRKQQRTD